MGGKMSKESLNSRLNRMLASGKPVSALTIIRLSAGITQTELAERSGMKQSYIARIENGKQDVKSISFENAYKLAQACDCDLETLMQWCMRKSAIKSATV